MQMAEVLNIWQSISTCQEIDNNLGASNGEGERSGSMNYPSQSPTVPLTCFAKCCRNCTIGSDFRPCCQEVYLSYENDCGRGMTD
jgi:hypothetical protein